MARKLRRLVKITKNVLLYSFALCFIYIFMIAWFNGGEAIVYINLIGEASSEFIIISIFGLLIFYDCIITSNEIYKEAQI